MTRTRGLVAALPVAGLVLACCALTGGCERPSATPALRMRAPSAADARARGPYLAVKVLELREQHGAVTVVLQASPQEGLGPLYVGHYDLSCALAHLRLTDDRGNAVRISDPVITVGAAAGNPGHVSLPARGISLAVELLDERHVVTATSVRGVVASPADGSRLTYSLDATVRAANGRLDSFMEVPLRGFGTLVFKRG
jgi:hypothetical protein